MKYPLVSRRFDFFSLKQARGETFSDFLAKKSFGVFGDIENLGIDGLYVYTAVVGIHSDYSELREKILQLPELTLQNVETTSRSYEIAQSTIKGIKSCSNSFANLAIGEDENSTRQVSDSRAKPHCWE